PVPRRAVASLAQLLLFYRTGGLCKARAAEREVCVMRNQARALMRAVGCMWILMTTAVAAQPDGGGAARYEVQPSDVLQVSVWREPELTQQVIVRPDGAFSFP